MFLPLVLVCGALSEREPCNGAITVLTCVVVNIHYDWQHAHLSYRKLSLISLIELVDWLS